MAVVLVEHNVGLVMSTCDRIVVLDFGEVIASGTPAEVRQNNLVRDAYLGTTDGEAPAAALITEPSTMQP